MHEFHGFEVILSGGLMGILHKFCLNRIRKGLYPGKLVVGDQAVIQSDGAKARKKPDRPLIRRGSMGHQGIVDIKDHTPYSFLI